MSQKASEVDDIGGIACQEHIERFAAQQACGKQLAKPGAEPHQGMRNADMSCGRVTLLRPVAVEQSAQRGFLQPHGGDRGACGIWVAQPACDGLSYIVDMYGTQCLFAAGWQKMQGARGKKAEKPRTRAIVSVNQ